MAFNGDAGRNRALVRGGRGGGKGESNRCLIIEHSSDPFTSSPGTTEKQFQFQHDASSSPELRYYYWSERFFRGRVVLNDRSL